MHFYLYIPKNLFDYGNSKNSESISSYRIVCKKLSHQLLKIVRSNRINDLFFSQQLSTDKSTNDTDCCIVIIIKDCKSPIVRDPNPNNYLLDYFKHFSHSVNNEIQSTKLALRCTHQSQHSQSIDHVKQLSCYLSTKNDALQDDSKCIKNIISIFKHLNPQLSLSHENIMKLLQWMNQLSQKINYPNFAHEQVLQLSTI